MTVFFQFAPPETEVTPTDYSDALVNFVFATNVAHQDVSGDVADSASAQVVCESLRPTPVRESVVLVAVSSKPDLSAFRRSPLGYPLIAADAGSAHPGLPDDVEVLGYVDATMTPGAQGVDADLVLGVDFLPETPGGPATESELTAWRELIAGIEEFTQAVGRTLIRIWHGVPLSGGEGDFEWELLDCGYYLGVAELCGVIPTSSESQWEGPVLPPGYDFVVYEDHRLPEQHREPLLQLYTEAEADMPVGGLTRDVVPWTRKRWDHQLRDGEQSLMVVLAHFGVVAGLSEVRRMRGSDCAEQQITVVTRRHRGLNLSSALKYRLRKEVQERWPEVRSIYTAVAEDNEPMLVANYSVDFQETSRTQCFEKVF